MEYPLIIDLYVEQDDFIEVEILEEELDKEIHKKSMKTAFIIETVMIAAVMAGMAVMATKGMIMSLALIFPAFFWLLFLFHFIYNYKWGIQHDFNMAVQHLLENKDSQRFFTSEKGLVYFYEDRCEYLTNEQRRFFEYDKIGNIKIIKHLYIFVMKRSKDKSMKGFAYMVIPRRNMNDHQQKQLDEICASIIKKYDLKEWVTSQIFG